MKILVVCLGNICRSPIAEGVLAQKLGQGFEVDSAGTISMHEGSKPDKRAIETAQNHGVDISMQKSRPITATDFEMFDQIYCMDASVYKDVISLTKNAREKQKVALFLLAADENSTQSEVPDPYWGDLDDFEAVYQLINKASEKIAAKLKVN